MIVAVSVMDDALLAVPLDNRAKARAALELAFRLMRDDDACDAVFHEILIDRIFQRSSDAS